MLKKTTVVLATLSLCLVAGCGGGATNNSAGNSGNASSNTAK